MKIPCPICCPFPKACPGEPFPLLGPSVSGQRKCPVCERIFNEQGLPITQHKTTAQKELDDTGEGENPGSLIKNLKINKICTVCSVSKSLDDFVIDKRSSDGRAPHCRDCHNAHKRYKYAEKRHEKIHEIAFQFKVSPALVRGIIDLWNE